VAELRGTNRIKPVHMIDPGGLKAAFRLSEIGSAMASADVIEVNRKTGADRFVLFGSAGALDRERTKGV